MPRLLPAALPRAALAAALAWAAAPAEAATVDLQASDAAGKPLSGAVLFLESKDARAAVKAGAQVDIVQAGRQFLPPVSVVTVGTPVNFPNRDTVRHHVYSFSPIKRFEIKLYVGTPTAPVVFDTPGIAVLGCNIHDTMAAWVVVLDTPYAGQTGADGRLSLANVPPGAYRLRAWHPSLPPGAPAQDQPLQVPASGGAPVAVKIAGAAA
jgi:plastocyanin